jgi:hypothetical protein
LIYLIRVFQNSKKKNFLGVLSYLLAVISYLLGVTFPFNWGCLYLLNGGTKCRLFGGLLPFNWGAISIYLGVNFHLFGDTLSAIWGQKMLGVCFHFFGGHINSHPLIIYIILNFTVFFFIMGVGGGFMCERIRLKF